MSEKPAPKMKLAAVVYRVVEDPCAISDVEEDSLRHEFSGELGLIGDDGKALFVSSHGDWLFNEWKSRQELEGDYKGERIRKVSLDEDRPADSDETFELDVGATALWRDVQGDEVELLFPDSGYRSLHVRGPRSNVYFSLADAGEDNEVVVSREPPRPVPQPRKEVEPRPDPFREKLEYWIFTVVIIALFAVPWLVVLGYSPGSLAAILGTSIVLAYLFDAFLYHLREAAVVLNLLAAAAVWLIRRLL